MLSAYVFLNCDIGTEPAIIRKIRGMSGVSEAVQVSGIYDIVAKVSEESREDITKLVKRIRAITNIRSSLTVIVPEEEHLVMKRIEVVA